MSLVLGLLFFCVSICFTEVTAGEQYALLVAGHEGFKNYAFQAMCLRIYRSIKWRNIPDSNIILMMPSDIQDCAMNPVKGSISETETGENLLVDEDPEVDFIGRDVTKYNVARALLGIGEPSLKSGSDDNVIIFYADHGIQNIGISMPYNAVFYSREFFSVIESAYEHKKFRKMVIMIEACYSGGLFDRVSEEMARMGVYAIAAASPFQKAYGCCGDYELGYSVSGEYGRAIADFLDNEDFNSKKIGEFFEYVRANTGSSSVLDYGDMSIKDMMVQDFFGLEHHKPPPQEPTFMRGKSLWFAPNQNNEQQEPSVDDHSAAGKQRREVARDLIALIPRKISNLTKLERHSLIYNESRAPVKHHHEEPVETEREKAHRLAVSLPSALDIYADDCDGGTKNYVKITTSNGTGNTSNVDRSSEVKIEKLRIRRSVTGSGAGDDRMYSFPLDEYEFHGLLYATTRNVSDQEQTARRLLKRTLKNRQKVNKIMLELFNRISHDANLTVDFNKRDIYRLNDDSPYWNCVENSVESFNAHCIPVGENPFLMTLLPTFAVFCDKNVDTATVRRAILETCTRSRLRQIKHPVV